MNLRLLFPIAIALLLTAACCPVVAPESEAQATAFTATVIGRTSDGLEVTLESGRRLVLLGDITAEEGTTLYVTGTFAGNGRIAVLRVVSL